MTILCYGNDPGRFVTGHVLGDARHNRMARLYGGQDDDGERNARSMVDVPAPRPAREPVSA